MELNASNLTILRTAVDLAWQQGLTDQASANSLMLLEDAFRRYPGTRKIAEFPFTDTFPGFKEWVDDRVIENLKNELFQVIARNFENTVSIPLDAIEDDDYGLYVDNLSIMSAMWPVLLSEILAEVFTQNKLCFTGKALFATNHKYGKNTLSNKVTDALSTAAFDAAFEAVAGWKFANGKPTRTRFSHLYVGPKLENTAKKILAALVVDGNAAVDNPNANKVELVVLPDFAGDYENYWVLADNRYPIKPLGLRETKTPTPRLPTDPYHVEVEGAAVAAADGRAEAFPTFPHLVYGGIVAAG